MEDCPHIHLTRLEDPDGLRNCYQCHECKEILVVKAEPYVITVTFGTPPEKK